MSDQCDVTVFLNTPVYYDSDSGQYSADYLNFIDFMIEFSREVRELTLCLPVGNGSGAVEFAVPENIEIVGFPFYEGPFDLLRNAHRIVPRLLQLAHSDTVAKCDLVGTVAPSTIATVVAPVCRYLMDKPLFMIMRGDKRQTVSNSMGKAGLKGLFLRSVIHSYDRLTARLLSDEQVTLFTIGDLSDTLREYGYDTEKVHALSPLVPRDIIVEDTNVDSSVRDLLFVGRLSGEKGVFDLLTSFADLVSNTDQPLTLHVVGSGPKETELWNSAHDLSIAENVEFHGFVPRGSELWELFDRSDVFILPSYTEGLPRVIGEAMARGLPVIATTVGGIPDLIDDGSNGLLVAPGDTRAMETAVQELIGDDELRKRLSKNSIRTALSSSFDLQSQRMATTLEAVLSCEPNSVDSN